MINVIKKFSHILKLFWDFILNIILFIFYLVLFFPYKLFLKKKNNLWWNTVEKYNLENKNLPF
jgi:hypothetical protein